MSSPSKYRAYCVDLPDLYPLPPTVSAVCTTRSVCSMDDVPLLETLLEQPDHVMTPAKKRIIQRYIELYRHRALGTTAEIYRTPFECLALTSLLTTESLAAAVSGAAALNVEYREGNYVFAPHQTYINFANRHLGGGVLGNGFVQEEFILCQSNFLPTLMRHPTFVDKTDAPVITRLSLFVDIDKQLYGDGMLATMMQSDVVQHAIRPYDQPVEILFAAMAAPVRPRHYTPTLLANMVARAYSTFAGAYAVHQQLYGGAASATASATASASASASASAKASATASSEPFVLNTGMWGCGAFRNDPQVIHDVQLYAWKLFMESMTPSVSPRLVYWTSDKGHLLRGKPTAAAATA